MSRRINKQCLLPILAQSKTFSIAVRPPKDLISAFMTSCGNLLTSAALLFAGLLVPLAL